MNAKLSFRTSDAAHPIKYTWVAILTLIATLVAGAFAPVLAGSVQESDLPFGLQSGLTTAHLDASGRFLGKIDPVKAISVAEKDLPFGLQSGLYTARGVGYQPPLNLAAGKGTPWGLQSGLVDAYGVGYRAAIALVGGKGTPFGLESGLVTAHLLVNGFELGR